MATCGVDIFPSSSCVDCEDKNPQGLVDNRVFGGPQWGYTSLVGLAGKQPIDLQMACATQATLQAPPAVLV
jgi:hypothetical protein